MKTVHAVDGVSWTSVVANRKDKIKMMCDCIVNVWNIVSAKIMLHV